MTWTQNQAAASWQSAFNFSSSAPNTVQGHLGYSVHSSDWIKKFETHFLKKNIAILYWPASEI